VVGHGDANPSNGSRDQRSRVDVRTFAELLVQSVLEALHLASRALITLLRSGGGGQLDLGSEVQLTHLRLEKTSETQAITPDKGVGELAAIYSGRGREMEATWLADEQLVAQARANPIENFRLVFNDVFIKSIIGRMDDNADIFQKILDEPAFQAAVMNHYLQRVFETARASKEHR
jgi:hypothetical protein